MAKNSRSDPKDWCPPYEGCKTVGDLHAFVPDTDASRYRPVHRCQSCGVSHAVFDGQMKAVDEDRDQGGIG